MPDEFADLRKYVPALAKFPDLLALAERGLGISQSRQLFQDSVEDENLFLGVAQRLGMKLDFFGEEIPKEGPAVVVANHAYGGADAIAIMAHCLKYRSDVKALANGELMGLAGVEDYFLPVSLMQEGNAAQENTSSLRGMLKHVKKGGCLVVFPAGRVSYWQGTDISDPEWNDHVVSLMQRMKTEIIPVWFFGGNPAWVQLLSQMSVFIRRALITRGLMQARHREISARVGVSFSSEALRDQQESGSQWLRKKIEELRDFGN